MNNHAPTRGDTGVRTDRRARAPLQAMAATHPTAAIAVKAEAVWQTPPDALMIALNAIDYGVMLIDAEARLRHANQAALRCVAPGSALRLVDDVVQPRSVGHGASFDRAVAAATRGRRSMVQLPAEDASLGVAFAPLACELAQGSVAVLLLLGKREPCQSLSVEFFAQQHRLTRAESAVLRGLCSGLQPTQIARSAGVAISTVRTQIGSLRSKTATPSIGELVRLVMLLPPMAPVLWSTV